MKILAVDDSLMIRILISQSVQSMGFNVLGAENGEEAFEILKTESENIKLILLDWYMPHMTGFEFLQKIKSIDAYKDIPVMMVTTESERVNVIKALKYGAVNYLTKPFTQEDISKKIRESLGIDPDDQL
jgi:two-component system chemotaxis response regulator CheY